MTEEQLIYKSIAQLIYNVTPDSRKKIHFIFFKKPHSHVTTIWNGNYLEKEGSFTLKHDASKAINDLFLTLYEKQSDFNLANWNVVHFILHENGSKFEIKYDFSSELDEKKLPFWKYCNRYKKPENKKAKFLRFLHFKWFRRA
ncbi:hypothetical protein [Microbulbifer sp. YPW1]|uniref:hypothetical protein n=1 Tax=Microbulbifer sp. YPW1 TaxID=2745199 RepID=UPI001598DBF8|nr:hypothetical protein [Microbulbifer sp. YPW1]QKX17747.1 hypothetical protein HUW35_12615 [Microbulbifer sp. YPW1]